jgi:Lon protease-like protein
MEESTREQEAALEAGDYDCALCLKLLCDPCTASCGHSFCKRCAYELVASHVRTDETNNNGRTATTSTPSLKCPICRAALDRRWVPSSSIALCRLLKLTFAKEYEARTAEEVALDQDMPRLPHAPLSSEGQKILPLFVLDSILPGQRTLLHIFEIRYRLLVQRALAEHGGRFGMVGFDRSAMSNGSEGIASFGTEVEMVSCLELPDGRFRLEVEGKSPFEVVNRYRRDGYWEASVQKIELDKENDENNDDDTTVLAQKVVELYDKWEYFIRSNRWERHPEHMDQVIDTLGPRPNADQPGSLAMWVAAAVNPHPPLGAAIEIRPTVLAATSDFDRLIIVHDAIKDSMGRVKKKRGTMEVLGYDMEINIIIFGIFGLLVGSFVQSYCRRIFVEFGFDRVLLGVYGNI